MIDSLCGRTVRVAGEPLAKPGDSMRTCRECVRALAESIERSWAEP